MTVLVPVWIARSYGVVPQVGPSVGELALQLAALPVLAVGSLLFASSLRRFAVDGQGTLAPWDPPRQLVVRGPYRYVRNPMISGVVFALFAEAMLLTSVPHLTWAFVFLAINLIFITVVEEPQLARRFGEPYREYCRRVPRIWPSLRPRV